MGEAVSPAPAGIDSLRSQSVQLAAPVVEPRSGVLIPPQTCNMRKKSPHFHASSSSNMAVRGGLTRFARPSGSLFASLSVCPTGCASCRTPVGGSHPPAVVQHAKKKPAFSCELFLKYGGEGGIDSLRSPCGQPVRFAHSLSNWLRQLSNPGRGFSSPPAVVQHAKKKARIFMRALLQIWR